MYKLYDLDEEPKIWEMLKICVSSNKHSEEKWISYVKFNYIDKFTKIYDLKFF